MVARLSWLGTALAAGLLLQIAVQIHALRWLPEFPVYLGLALLSAAAVLLAAPLALVAMVGKRFSAGRSPPWLQAITLAGFAFLALSHAILAAKSSSSALEWWRNILLWPSVLAGVAACLLSRPRWTSLLFLLPLGEAATGILACWYAPSFGESQSFRAYQYVLIAAAISLSLLLPAVIAKRRVWTSWWCACAAATAALALICIVQPDTGRAQPLMMGVAALRLCVILAAVNGWLKHWAEQATAAPAGQL